MATAVEPHPWAKEALLAKATLFMQNMQQCSPDDDSFGRWSALALELLARAAVAHSSPALLADGKDWRNIAFALGHPPATPKFQPKSLATNAVLQILTELNSSFTKEHAGFCSEHTARRNRDLHTGELVFGSHDTDWLPRFYQVCVVMLALMGEEPAALFPDAESVLQVINALEDRTAAKVRESIKAFRKVWNEKTEEVDVDNEV